MQKRSGQWSVAAPPNWPLNDLTILLEVDGEVGRELLLALYNARLYAETPVHLRAELFEVMEPPAPDLSAAAEIEDSLDLLLRLPREPLSITERELARACRVVAEWAEDRSHSVTAVAFAELAARLVPDNPELSNRAGRACRRAGERERAELWYERGFGLARRRGDVLQYVKGHLGYGSIFRDHGEYARALHWVKRASIAARKGGHREAGAEAMHDAFTLAYLEEDLPRAASLIRRAARIYPVHARRVPYFAADMALLLTRRGMYGMALELLRIVQGQLTAPVDCLQVWGLVAFASGGAEDRPAFARALENVCQMAELYRESSAASLAYAAAGAHLLRDWDLAEGLIAEATARAAGDTLSTDLAARVGRDIARRSTDTQGLTQQDPATDALRAIVPEVAARVRRWRGPTWRPRRE
jgi:tetratricopeptide (TPR) repeat protein